MVKGLKFTAYPSSSSVDRTMASPGGKFSEVLGNRKAKEDGEANNEDVACHVHVRKLKLWNPSSHCSHDTHNTIIKPLQLPMSPTSRCIHKHWFHIETLTTHQNQGYYTKQRACSFDLDVSVFYTCKTYLKVDLWVAQGRCWVE